MKMVPIRNRERRLTRRISCDTTTEACYRAYYRSLRHSVSILILAHYNPARCSFVRTGIQIAIRRSVINRCRLIAPGAIRR